LSDPDHRGPYLAYQLHRIVNNITHPDADLTLLRRVIAAGVDVNVRNEAGQVAVLHTMRVGHVGALRLLLDAGAYFSMDDFSSEDTQKIAANRVMVLALMMYGVATPTLYAERNLEAVERCVVTEPDNVEKLSQLLADGAPVRGALLYATGAANVRLLPTLLAHTDVTLVQRAIEINRAVLLRPLSAEMTAANHAIKDMLAARLRELRPVHWYCVLIWQALAMILPPRTPVQNEAVWIDPTLNRWLEEHPGAPQTLQRRDTLTRSTQRELVLALVCAATWAAAYYYMHTYSSDAP
jgi:hypothetical protein